MGHLGWGTFRSRPVVPVKLNRARKQAVFRTSEWVLIGFFAYVLVISHWFPQRPYLKHQPFWALAAVSCLLFFVVRAQREPITRTVSIIRDWLPIPLALVAFREMELFLPLRFDHHLETSWIRWDIMLLCQWHLQRAIESLGPVIPFYLELCYFLVYGVSAYCIGVMYSYGERSRVDRFLTIYLAGTLAAYTLFPYFPSQPPRIAFPEVAAPHVLTWVRSLNLFILSEASIHSGVFPSAHVSSVFSAAWAMFALMPKRHAFGWITLFYALSVSLATIYGRYHYTADVVAGFGVSLLAGAVCLVICRTGPRHLGLV
jgi:membrane-associated phospholipid phosphatase